MKELDNKNTETEIQWDVPIEIDNMNLPVFNTDVFPLWLKDYIEAVAEETQTPKDAASMACFSILSTAIAGKFFVQAKKDWIESLNTYTVMALDPANRKSAVFSLFLRPIIEFEADEKRRLTPIVVEENAKRNVLNKKIGMLEQQYGKEKDNEKAKALLNQIKVLSLENNDEVKPLPIIPRLFTNDVTPEKIAMLMYENNERLAILSAEGAEVFQMIAGRYSEKINLEIYLKGYSGDNVTIDRASGKSISLDNPLLTIGLFVQPSVIQDIPSSFSSRGLTQRFLYFLPKSFIGNRKIVTQVIPEDFKEQYFENVRKLLAIRQSHKVPLTFDFDAQKYLIQIQYEIESMLANHDINNDFKGWLGKLCGQIIRIAGLIHVAEKIHDDIENAQTISLETLLKADSLREYFIQHAERAFGIIGQKENLDDTKYILKKIQSDKFKGKGKIDVQQLWQLTKRRLKKSAKLKEILKLLEEMNYVKNLQIDRKEIILVNPKIINNY